MVTLGEGLSLRSNVAIVEAPVVNTELLEELEVHLQIRNT